jgi:CRP/FNR family transcriptional regulator, cyclic AMP receptor protein
VLNWSRSEKVRQAGRFADLRFGAVATQPTQAFAFDARAVRKACDADPVLGYELSRRFSAVVVRRLQATRARLIDAWTHPEAGP